MHTEFRGRYGHFEVIKVGHDESYAVWSLKQCRYVVSGFSDVDIARRAAAL